MGILGAGFIIAAILYVLYHINLPYTKELFWAFFIIIALAYPPLGAMVVCIGIIYAVIIGIKEGLKHIK